LLLEIGLALIIKYLSKGQYETKSLKLSRNFCSKLDLL